MNLPMHELSTTACHAPGPARTCSHTCKPPTPLTHPPCLLQCTHPSCRPPQWRCSQSISCQPSAVRRSQCPRSLQPLASSMAPHMSPRQGLGAHGWAGAPAAPCAAWAAFTAAAKRFPAGSEGPPPRAWSPYSPSPAEAVATSSSEVAMPMQAERTAALVPASCPAGGPAALVRQAGMCTRCTCDQAECWGALDPATIATYGHAAPWP